MHCITAFKSVTNSPRDHNWSRPKNFYQQLTLFLNKLHLKQYHVKKKLYRRTSPPEIGAERWADNTSTMSKRRMSFSLSSLQTSYTVSFGFDFARNSITSLPAVSWLFSRETIRWSSIAYLTASCFQVRIPGFFLVRRFPTFSWILESTFVRHLSSKSKEK